VPRIFASRTDAARRIAGALRHYRGTHPLVLAVPRGAVGIGALVADALEGDLDVVLVRKLRAPGNPEYAIGAIDESGWTYLSPEYFPAGAETSAADRAYLEDEKRQQLETLRARRAYYTPARPRIDPAGRNVIVVDDGAATGSSMIAALHTVRAQHPAHLVCAVPVAPAATAEILRRHADELVCLETPFPFYAVGDFYVEFNQVNEATVLALLAARR